MLLLSVGWWGVKTLAEVSSKPQGDGLGVSALSLTGTTLFPSHPAKPEKRGSTNSGNHRIKRKALP